MSEQIPAANAIRPTPEREAKGGLVKPEQGRSAIAKPWFAVDCAISEYLMAGVITKRQAEAGYQFQAVWYLSNGHPLKAQSYEPAIRGGETDHTTDRQLAAKGKLTNYRQAHGHELFACLVAVAGLGQSHSVWGKEHLGDPRVGKAVLRIALSKHADLLKLPE